MTRMIRSRRGRTVTNRRGKNMAQVWEWLQGKKFNLLALAGLITASVEFSEAGGTSLLDWFDAVKIYLFALAGRSAVAKIAK